MKKTNNILILGIVVLMGSQILYADWTDDMTYADDAAIQAVYSPNSGLFSSAYSHVNGQSNYTYTAHTALGLLASNGKYAARALNRVAGTHTFSVEAWILPYTYADPDNPYTAAFNLNNATGWDDWHASVRSDGNLLQVYAANGYYTLDLDGDGDVDAADVLAEDIYYKIKIVATPDSVNGGHYDVYINDVLAYEGAGFRNGNRLEDSTYVRFSRGGTGGATMAVDDVTVTSVPLVGTLIVIQ